MAVQKWFKNLENRITQISQTQFQPRLFSLEWVLEGISKIYGTCAGLRLFLYEKGVLKSRKLSCTVISIGNIVAGGAGKTPMTLYLAGLLTEMGKKTIVVSRGYGGQYKGKALIVSDGNRVLADSKLAGDEPFMMAQAGKFPVVVGKDRAGAGARGIEAFNPDVIVLDDGFQHLRLERDIDLVLMDCQEPLGNTRFLPAGRLRETPLMSSSRTDALIFTRCSPGMHDNDALNEIIGHYPGIPWFRTFHVPFISDVFLRSDKACPEDICDPSRLKGKKALIFSGIAKNFSFYQSVSQYGINIADHLEFSDHYRYKDCDIEMINTAAEKSGADIIMTTQKDWTRLKHGIKWSAPVVVMGIRIQFEEPERFRSFIQEKLEGR